MPAVRRRLSTAAAGLAVVVSCIAWTPPATAAPSPPGACAPAVLGDGTLPRTFAAGGCDLTGRKVRTPVGELTVPTAGRGVGAERVLPGGRTVTAVVEHRPDGTVVARAMPAPSAAAAAARPDTGCTGSAYELAGSEFTSAYRWYFNAGGLARPGQLRDAVIRGLEDVSQRQTNCGPTTPLPAAVQPQYLGATTVAPGITPSGGCDTDGTSVVGFGPLDGGWWGMSCWSWDAHGTVEADVLFAEGQRWWTRPVISTCRGRIDVEGLAAHEFGHVFGLLHVDDGAHPDQTMSTYLNGYCSKIERTLGTGDLAGLARLYGA